MLARVFHLASPALPVGAFSYSQGLEAAHEAGLVRNEADARRWIADVLELCVATMDVPVLLRMMASPQERERLDALYLATRETAELRAETLQMGYSLCRLLRELGEEAPAQEQASFPLAFAAAASAWGVEAEAAAQAYLWGWLENQVMAALKCVPLGQTAGQRILRELGGRIEALVDRAAGLPEERWSNLAPGLALLSSRHETQYSRLFRS